MKYQDKNLIEVPGEGQGLVVRGQGQGLEVPGQGQGQEQGLVVRGQGLSSRTTLRLTHYSN